MTQWIGLFDPPRLRARNGTFVNTLGLRFCMTCEVWWDEDALPACWVCEPPASGAEAA